MIRKEKQYGSDGVITRQWKMRIIQWKESGLSQKAFCREHKLKASTFSWWVRKLGSSTDLPAAMTPSVTFACVNRQAHREMNSMPQGNIHSPTQLALSFGGMELKFSDQLLPARLNAFLSALRGL